MENILIIFRPYIENLFVIKVLVEKISENKIRINNPNPNSKKRVQIFRRIYLGKTR